MGEKDMGKIKATALQLALVALAIYIGFYLLMASR